MRIGYLSLDAAGRTGANPLTNEKVRQAIAYAIDRAAMARDLVGTGSRPLNAPCYPSQIGCETESRRRLSLRPRPGPPASDGGGLSARVHHQSGDL